MKEYKGYYIKNDNKTPQLVSVVTVGKGGKIPNVLQGLFTSEKLAMDTIDRYVNGKKDGETVSKSGD